MRPSRQTALKSAQVAIRGSPPLGCKVKKLCSLILRSFEWSWCLFLAAGIGFLAGLIAYLLYNLIGFFTNIVFYHRFVFAFDSARNNHLGPWVIVMPVIGGIIVGFMAKYGSPKIKGHGIPEAMEAVLVNRSRIQPRVAFLKPISAAIAIGTGGPFGAEGPIIQTGGAVGSLIGQLVHTTASERKVLLACGAAAGMSATFNTPIAGVILAIELLLFEFKSRSFHSAGYCQLHCHGSPHATAGSRPHVYRFGHGFRRSSRVAFLFCSGGYVAWLPWASASCSIGPKISSKNCRLTSFGGRRSVHWAWESSDTSCPGC